MVGADEAPDSAKVVLAATALIEKYGDDALQKALEFERDSNVKVFAKAVRMEVENRRRDTLRDK